MDNENPTILNASDLPSRRRQPKRTLSSALSGGGTGLLSNVAPAAYTRDPFAFLGDLSTGSASAGHSYSQQLIDGDEYDGEDDDSIVDQVDEQEIYGK